MGKKRRFTFFTDNETVVDVLEKIPVGSRSGFIEVALVEFLKSKEFETMMVFFGLDRKDLAGSSSKVDEKQREIDGVNVIDEKNMTFS